MRIPSPRPDEIRALRILATIFKTTNATRRGATFRYVASVIPVALLVLINSVSILRQIVAAILQRLGGLPTIWLAILYEMAERNAQLRYIPTLKRGWRVAIRRDGWIRRTHRDPRHMGGDRVQLIG